MSQIFSFWVNEYLAEGFSWKRFPTRFISNAYQYRVFRGKAGEAG
jgi:hypothetical protein